MAKHQIEIGLSFTADTSRAKVALEQLDRDLTTLMKKTVNESHFELSDELAQAQVEANKLNAALKTAVDMKTGKFDLSKFERSLKNSNTSLNTLRKTFAATGVEGQKAFMSLAQSIVAAETPARRMNKRLAETLDALKRTAQWQLSSTVVHGITGAIQTAYHYAQDLNESLNNIRIVTGYSAEQMQDFAKEANKAAKSLSTTTNEYTKASLIYFQQGLSDKEVKERTAVTVKLAQAAGESAEEVSSYMTAIWNNFANDEAIGTLESYADAIAALGAATASSSEEIATGMQKFAAVANTVGLSYEYAAAALATVTATTRESAETVGTAFKTIFARLESLSLGETLDDDTNMTKYSMALAKVGVNIKDVSGTLKDMDTILDELGSKWNNISQDQQIALAQTVAGMRQYNNFMALMSNYDFFQENIQTAKNSDGELQKQADIYAESWEAARDRVQTAAENIYQKLINDDFFIDLLNKIEKIIGYVGSLIDSLGGVEGLLTVIGALVTRVFSKQIGQSLRDAYDGLNNLLGFNKKASEREKQTAFKEAKAMLRGDKKQQPENIVFNTEITGMEKSLDLQRQLNQYADNLTEEQRAQAENLIKLIELQYKHNAALAEEVKITQSASNLEKTKVASIVKEKFKEAPGGGDKKHNEFLAEMESFYKSAQNIRDGIPDEEADGILEEWRASAMKENARREAHNNEVGADVRYAERMRAAYERHGGGTDQVNYYEMALAMENINADTDPTVNRIMIPNVRAMNLTALEGQMEKAWNEGQSKLSTESLQDLIDVPETRATMTELEQYDALLKDLELKLVSTYQLTNEEATNFVEVLKRELEAGKSYADAMASAEEATKKFGNELDAMNKKASQPKISDLIAKTVTAVTSLHAGINALQGAWEAISNPELDGWEMFAQVMMSSFTAVTMLGNAVGGIVKVGQGMATLITNAKLARAEKAADSAATEANTVATHANTAAVAQNKQVRENRAGATDADTSALNRDTANQMGDTDLPDVDLPDGDGNTSKIDVNGNQVAQEITGEVAEQGLEEGAEKLTQKGVKQGGEALTKSSLKGAGKGGSKIATKILGKAGPWAAAAAIAITTVVATIAIAKSQLNKAQKEADEARKKADKARELANSVKQEYESLASAASEWEESNEALKEKIKDTEEYTDALRSANDQAKALIESNDFLKDKYEVINGQYVFEEGALEEAERLKEQQASQAEGSAIAAEIDAIEKQEKADRKRVGRNTGDTAGMAMLKNVGGGALMGAAGGAAIGTVFNAGYGTLIGAGIGAFVGGVSGAIATEAAGSVTKRENRAFDAIAENYEELENVLKTGTDEELTKALKEVVGVDNDLIAAIVENREEITNLTAEMAENNIILQRTYEELVRANAGGNPLYDESDAQGFIDIDLSKRNQNGNLEGVLPYLHEDLQKIALELIEQNGVENVRLQDVYYEAIANEGLLDGGEENNQKLFDLLVEAGGFSEYDDVRITDKGGTDVTVWGTKDGQEQKLAGTHNNNDKTNDYQIEEMAKQLAKIYATGYSGEDTEFEKYSIITEEYVAAMEQEQSKLINQIQRATNSSNTDGILAMAQSYYRDGTVSMRYLGQGEIENLDIMKIEDPDLQNAVQKSQKQAMEAWDEIQSNYSEAAKEAVDNLLQFDNSVSNSLTQDSLKNYMSSVDDVEKRGGEDLVNQYSAMLNELLFENPEKVNDILATADSIEWGGQFALNEFQNALSETGVSISSLGNTWTDFATLLKDSPFSLLLMDLEKTENALTSVRKALKDLSYGDIISDQAYNNIKAMNPEIAASSFMQTADGDWMYFGKQSGNEIAEENTLTAYIDQYNAIKDAAPVIENIEEIQDSKQEYGVSKGMYQEGVFTKSAGLVSLENELGEKQERQKYLNSILQDYNDQIEAEKGGYPDEWEGAYKNQIENEVGYRISQAYGMTREDVLLELASLEPEIKDLGDQVEKQQGQEETNFRINETDKKLEAETNITMWLQELRTLDKDIVSILGFTESEIRDAYLNNDTDKIEEIENAIQGYQTQIDQGEFGDVSETTSLQRIQRMITSATTEEGWNSVKKALEGDPEASEWIELYEERIARLKEEFQDSVSVIEDYKTAIETLQRLSENAEGQNLINLLKQEAKEYTRIMRRSHTERQASKKAMRNVLEEAGITTDLDIDEFGNIANLEALKQKMGEKYLWNTSNENYQEFLTEIEKYEKANTEFNEAQTARTEIQIQANTELYNSNKKLRDSQDEIYQWQLSNLENIAFSGAKALSLINKQTDNLKLNQQDVMSSINKLGNQAGLWDFNVSGMSNLSEYIAAIKENLPEATETLDELTATWQENIATLQEYEELLRAQVIKRFEDLSNAYADVNEELASYTNTLSYYKDIMELLGEDTFNSFGVDYDDLVEQNINARKQASLLNVKSSKEEYDAIVKERAIAEKEFRQEFGIGEDVDLSNLDMEAFMKTLDEAQQSSMASWSDTFNEIEAKEQAALENTQSVFVSSLQEAYELLAEETEIILDNLQEKLAGIYGSIEEMSERFAQSSELNNQYISDYKKIYELNKLTRNIQKDIDNTDSIAAKQSLRELQEEMNELQAAGTEMSEYDLEYLQKKYDLRLAEIALEESQNAKSQVRLQKMADGSWGYVYTQNAEAVSNAQQDYEDKLYALQELSNNYLDETSSNILSIQQEYEAALNEIVNNSALSPEAREAEMERITEYYTERLGFMTSEMDKVFTYMQGVDGVAQSFSETLLGTLYTESGMNYTSSSDILSNFVDIAVNETLPQLKEALKDTTEYINTLFTYNGSEEGTAGFATSLSSAVDQISSAIGSPASDEGSATGLYSSVEKLQELFSQEVSTAFYKSVMDQVTDITSSIKELSDFWKELQGIIDEPNSSTIFKSIDEVNKAGYTLADVDYVSTLQGYKLKAASYDTGGYTGEWGSEGKLAVLHEKELVLNSDDTINFLIGMTKMETILAALDSRIGYQALAHSIGASTITSNGGTLQQEVTIHAEFPNATNRSEIEAAFDNLINRASQRANKTR